MLKQNVYQQYSWEIEILLSNQDFYSQRVSEISEGVAYIKADMKVDMRFPYAMKIMQMQTPPPVKNYSKHGKWTPGTASSTSAIKDIESSGLGFQEGEIMPISHPELLHMVLF